MAMPHHIHEQHKINLYLNLILYVINVDDQNVGFFYPFLLAEIAFEFEFRFRCLDSFETYNFYLNLQ